MESWNSQAGRLALPKLEALIDLVPQYKFCNEPKGPTPGTSWHHLLYFERGGLQYHFPRPSPETPQVVMRAGEALLWEPSMGGHHRPTGPEGCLMLGVSFKGAVGKSEDSGSGESKDGSPDRFARNTFSRSEAALLLPHLQAMVWEFSQKGLGWRTALHGHYLLLSTALTRFKTGEQPAVLHPLTGPEVARAMAFFYEHYRREINLEEVARAAGVSGKRLIGLFREAALKPPMTFLRELRLKEAQELLRLRGMRVKEAASATGFQSVSAFSRAYVRLFKRPPSF